MTTTYDTALVCLNGHMITDSTRVDPEPDKKYCDACGKELISNCVNCNSPIHGRYYVNYHITGQRPITCSDPAKFCYSCGKPYPWMESAIDAANNYASSMGVLSPEEVAGFNSSLQEIIVDSPKTELFAVKMKMLVSKLGAGAGGALRDFLVDVISES